MVEVCYICSQLGVSHTRRVPLVVATHSSTARGRAHRPVPGKCQGAIRSHLTSPPNAPSVPDVVAPPRPEPIPWTIQPLGADWTVDHDTQPSVMIPTLPTQRDIEELAAINDLLERTNKEIAKWLMTPDRI